MEECERKKKLKAGKEKLAAFQKKKIRKKKKVKDGDSTILEIDVGEVSDVSSTSEISSGAETQSNEDSDQQSMSGLSDDENPKEEVNLPSLLRLKGKLQSANQRIEELEECIMGKQLALDKVIVENEKLRKEVTSEQVEKFEDFELKESEYVTQKSMQVSESVNGDSGLNGEKGDLSDIQDLTQQVQWLQVQLKQAGITLQVQADHQSLSVQALQEAKSEILNLQQNVTQKDQVIYQLAEKLTQVSQQYSLLQRAHDSLKNEDKKDADSVFSVTEVEVKMEGLKLELETEYKRVLNDMTTVLEGKKQELEGIQNENEELKKVCETSQIELRNEREEFEKKIATLSEELMNAQTNNEKIRQHLESVDEKNRALLDEWDRTKTEKEEANFKIKFLEQQLKDSLDHMETDKLKLESVEIELLSEREEKVKMDKELQKYKEEVMMLKEEKENANLNLQHFIEENKSLKDEKEKANAERSLLQKQFEDFKESFSSEFQSLTSQLNETLEQMSDMKSVNEVLSQEVEKLKAEKSGMLEQLDMYHCQVAEYEGTISQMHGLQEENQALRMQNDELYNKINNQKDIIVGLKAELDVLSVDNKQLGEQLQVFTSDLSQHQSEIDIIETERHAFREEMENLQRHYMDLQSESEVYKSSTASLSQKIAELKQELSISKTDNSSQLDTRSSADDYQIAESAQRRMMPLEECTITPSVVTHEENYDNTESAVLTTWALDQAQSLESQNNIIEQQSQRVEEGMIVPDVSTVITVHLDKTWEDESSLNESPDTPEISPTLLKLASNNEEPSQSSLDQITLLADKIQKLYSILAAVSVQNLVSCSLAIDGNTGSKEDDSDAKNSSFMYGGDGVERKQDKDLLFMAEQSERVRLENLRTGIQNLQKSLSSLNYSLEIIFPSSPGCSVTIEVGDPMPCDSPKQMPVTSLDDIDVKLEALSTQYEEQLEKLRQDLELVRQRTGEERQSDLMPLDKPVSLDFRQSLPTEQQRKLDNLLTDLDEFYEDRIKNLQQKHVEELGIQVKAMRISLEQIYQSRENLTKSELEARYQITLAELEETLIKKHKEELKNLEADWSNRMEDLKLDYDRELRDSLLEDSLVIQTVEVSLPYVEEEKNVDFIRKLNKKLCDEHKQLLQKISEDLEKESVKRGFSPKKIHTTRDSQTDSEFDDTESVKSAPVTQEEFHFLQERDNTIESAEDVVQTLEGQRQEITQLRSRLLSEYEQLLALRTEVMASQSQEVEKQQKEMMDIRHDYEEQMKTFQTKIETRTEEMLRSRLTEEHKKELEQLKEYYESKVKDAEETYRREIQQLQQTISDLQDGHRSTPPLPETEPPARFEEERAYVKKTAVLTVISDTESTPPESPPKTEEVYEVQLREMDKMIQSQDAKLKQLEEQLKEKDCMLLELQKRLEEEVNIETELHGKLLDDTKSLEDMEDDLKARSQEIQNLKKLLVDRDTRIAGLEKEVEKGKKDEAESESDQSKVIKELNTKIDELGKELFSYKEIERKMREEIDELTVQHQHALEALKVEVELMNVIKHEEEIRNQAEELSNKYEQEMKKQADFLENRHNDELHKQAEAIKQKMNAQLREQAVALTRAHEEEVKKLTNEYESKLRYLKSTSASNASEGDESLLGEERMSKISGAYDESLNRTMDELRHVYEEKISELQLELEDLKSKLEIQVEQAVTTDESVMREHIRDELSEEFEEKVEQMKQEYEEKLEEYERQLREFEEKVWKSESAEEDSSASLPSEVVSQEITKDNEEAVEYIGTEYQQRDEELQSQPEAQLESQGKDLITYDIVDSGLKNEIDRDEKDKDIEFLKEKIRVELEVEYEEKFARLKEDYDKLLTDSKEKLIEAQFNLEDSRKVEEDDKNLADEIRKDYEFRLKQLKTEYESKEKEFKERLSDMSRILEETRKEKDQGEKKSREKYQAMPDQAKKDYENRISEMRREYEEKMDLLRDELQEMWEAEKTELIQEYKHALAEVEEKYESLVEGIRTGDAPEVASIIHEKYDTELVMAKALMQQEFDEMLENEQTNYLEEQNKLIERFSRERAEDARKLKEKYEQELEDLRTSFKVQNDQELNDLRESLTHDHVLKAEAIEKEFAAQLEEARSARVSDEDVLETLREEMAEMGRRQKEQLELYEERIEKLQAESQLAGAEEEEGKVSEDAEALEIAHQQELQDLEEKLTEKHNKELDNLEKQLRSQIEEMSHKHKAEIEALEEELQMLQDEARRTPVQEEMIEEATSSTHEVIQKVISSPTEDLVKTVVTSTSNNDESQSEMEEEEVGGGTSSSSQSFEADDLGPTRSTPRDDIFAMYEEPQGQETGSPRGSLRGVDRGLDGKDDLITFEDEEEEDSDKSFADDPDVSDLVTVKSVNSITPTNLLQTLQFGVMAPTVTSLEDSQESLKSRIRELEVEVERLNEKLQEEVEQRDIILSRSERDRQEGSNLVTMLRDDVEQITAEKNALQTTNEHLLSLLSDSAKTFMEVEETIGKKLKAVSDKSLDKHFDRPGSGGKHRDATTPKGSPTSSPPARGSPGGAEGGEKNTSVLSNVTDEGLDLSQQISESIFHGPDLIPEEEELIIDAGRRLQFSVTRLLEMWGQSTVQLFETRTTQAGLLTDAEENRNDAEQLRVRCEDLEERLRDEVEAKDYLAMELHKAEGLIEGYSAERETLNQTIQNYEENKEALVAELETLRSRLQDLEAIQRENKSLQQELECQRNIIEENGGQEAQVAMMTSTEVPPGDKALVLEVNRLSSEKREVESQMHQYQERYESRVRELETSGEDMEHHYMQMLDEKKQELQDLRLQLDSVEKQLKAKKQFIEEQSIEREQEREEFQKELDKWKKLVQGKEKQESTESRLQNELDDLSEQLQSKIDSHNQMVVMLDKLQYEMKEKDVMITELKTVVHQVEEELEQKSNEIRNLRQKIAKMDGELTRRPLSGELLTESLKLEEQSLRLKSESYADLAEGVVQHRPPLKGQMTVDKELRIADDKDKEELIQERDALQAQVEEQLIQISALRNQLDDMRHLTKFSDPSEAGRRLQAEREKTEELENEISKLKQKIEELEETVANRDQQLQQLWSRTDSISSHETMEERNEKQEAIRRLEQQNAELKERVRTLQARTPISNISGLSQSLIEEKNQEIDHLMEELRQAQVDLQELQTEKGVSSLYKELESVKKQLYQSEKQLTELQQLQMSHSSETPAVDTSLTPDQSILGPRDSFSEKASIQQELEESVAHKLDRMINLEAEVKSLKKVLQEKEEEIVLLKTKEVSSLEDPSFYRDMIQEKELMITQLMEQIESLQSEVDNLTDFQNKLQEDFDTVQAMLEEKDKEIESLNTELTERSPEMTDEHELVIKHEVEIARLKKALKEKDNVIEEKKEEIAEILDKLEQQELDIAEIKETKARLQVQERELETLASKLEKQEDGEDIQSSLNEKEEKIKEQEKEISYLKDELSKVQEHLQIAENLQRKLEDAGLVTPESINREREREDEMKRLQAQVLTMQEKMKIKEVEAVVGLKGDETDTSESEKEDLPLTADGIYIDEEYKAGSDNDQIIQEKDQQIALLKQQVAQALMIRPPTPIDETEKDAVIHEKEEEIEMLRKQVAQALMVKPPQPDDEIEEEMQRLRTELESLKESQKNRGQDQLEEKLEEVQGLKKEIKEKDQKIRSKEDELQKVLKELQEMEQELVSQKNMRFYEETLQLQEKDEEIQLLQDELESLRDKSRSFEKSDTEKSDDGQNQDVHSLKRRMSFYEEQYEAKSAEVRELQVNLDIAREQLDKEKRSRAEEIEEEVRVAKEEMERKKRQEIKNLEENVKYLERDRDQKVLEILEFKRELTLVKDRLERETEHKQKEMDELITKMDKDRKENLASFQELEKALEDSMAKRRSSQEALMEVQQKLNSTLDQDNEFKTKILKLQNQIKDLEEEREQERNEYTKELQVRAKAGEVERLQKEIGTLQKQAERVNELQKQVKAIHSEKEQYQAQIRQLEKDYDNLNTKKKLEVESLEEQIRTSSSLQPGSDVLQKLQVTQDRLDHTTAQLEETGTQLAETKEKMKQLSDELHRYKNEMQKLQQELGRTSTDLRETSIRLQETEQKLKFTVDHVAEREEQIHRLQGELQQVYSNREWTKEQDDLTFRISELQSHLNEKEQELEEVKQRLNEAVELSEEQLKHVEQKDQEFTKLKLDIQQMMAEKDKKLQDAKKQLQQATAEKEEEVAAVTLKMEELLKDKSKQVKQLQEQLAQLRSAPEGAGGDLSTTLATMKTQLQEREYKIKELQSEIKKLATKLEQGQSVGQISRDQISQELTIEETEKQMQQLRRELLIAKTALKQLQKGSDLEGDQETVEDEVTKQIALEARENVSWLSEEDERSRLLEKLEQIKTELELFRSTSNMTAKDFVQKVMDLKSELSAQHQQHIQDITQRSQLELERQLAQLHFKYEDQVQHQSLTYQKEMEQKLNELQRNLEREYKREINKLKVRHQDEIEILQARLPDADSSAMDHVQQLQSEVALGQRLFKQRQDGVGQDKQKPSSPARNGFPDDENISKRLQILLNRLHNEGVQVLTLSELEYLNRNMIPSSIPAEMDMETLRVAWENERQSLLSTIQSLKDLLAQTHKLRGLEKSFEGSDWRGELLRAIGYVFTKEREALFAELRSHVLSHPSTDVTEIQKLEQKIRNQESHQVAALDQIFSADRQSLLSEVRDLRAHATIMRMQHQEERDRLKDQFDNLEDQSTKKERQLKRQVQLLEFKIQQEKVLQEDLRTSLDLERHRTSDLSTALNKEKNTNLDLQSDYSGMQVQLARLRENLEREQNRFVSVTSALEEEKAKNLKLTEQLQDERGVNWKLKSEIESLQAAIQQGQGKNSQRIETLQEELKTENEKRIQVETLHERDQAIIKSLRQEKERESHQLHSLDADYQNKIKQMTALIEIEKKKTAELASALDRERNLTASLRQSLEAERSIPMPSAQEQVIVEDLETELENQKALVHDLHAALEQEKANFKNLVDASEEEKTLILEQLDQDRSASRQLKKELDQAQQQKLELTRKYENERDIVNQLKAERDQLTSDLKTLQEQANLKEHELDSQRIADKRNMRQAERDKEDIRVKMREQDLEIQRLKKRVIDLEDLVTESRENELEAIRELENEKLRNFTHSSALDRLSGSSHQSNRKTDILDEEKKLQVYHSQLESICQSLQYLLLRCREQLSKSSHESQSGLTDFQTLQNSLKDLMTEIRQLQELGDSSQVSGIHVSGVNERILRHNEELTSFVSRISEEKTELRNTLTRLEEDIWRYRQMESKMKDLERTSDSNDDKLLAERAAWAKERLSLQMALNKVERELEQTQVDLRVERARRLTPRGASAQASTETDTEKIQRLYGKYLRAESFRKALIYQKKYLLLLLGGFQDTEETTLSLIARMGVHSSVEDLRNRQLRPLMMFRSAVRVCVAVSRMRYLVKKWRRAIRVGSEVVSGALDSNHGYIPQTSSYSPPRASTSSRLGLPHQSSLRFSDPSSLSSAYSQLEVDTRLPSYFTSSVAMGASSRVHTTPPTKDYSSSRYMPQPLSGARRKILSASSSSQPEKVKYSMGSSSDQDEEDHHCDDDEYISRLENLQNRLGSLQNGKPLSWKQPWR
ncbi:hypothetical protein CHS0354_042986 [Potamilus streckersoni]|uniref:ELK domain-containing protein n=1 Tax=Potamilus streckersoni TaxID=2493646 RepID=A0AAE0T3J9_9BIVA|nr:hypothetical protein CHS0354_042986 [Potamilus streckersoni]